jgi:palmitoyltransferase ZDHHC9/14/18
VDIPGEGARRISEELHSAADFRPPGVGETDRDVGESPPTAGSKSSAGRPALTEQTYGRPPHFRHSLAEASSQHATQAEYSSDDLVSTQQKRGAGKLEVEKDSPKRRASSQRYPSYHERNASHRQSRQPDTPQRRYQLFDNPLSTFWLKGRVMTGGDNYLSVALVLVLLLGITGVWFGTTGIWYWQYAGDYGLIRGGGIAIDIVFV